MSDKPCKPEELLIYSFKYGTQGGTEGFMTDVSEVWLNRPQPEGDRIVTRFKIWQRVRVAGEGPLLTPMVSRLDLRGGSSEAEGPENYPLAAWILGTPEDGATPFELVQLFGNAVQWQSDIPAGELQCVLAGNPGCDGCISVGCPTATIRLFTRTIGPLVPDLEVITNVSLWLRPRCGGCQCCD